MKINDYDSIERHWLHARKALPPKDRELFELFLGTLPINSKILDLGCGHGAPIATLLATGGHKIVGIDRSEKLLGYARNTLPEHEWILSDLEDFEPADSYDGIVIWDSLFHLPRANQLTLLRKAAASLKPKGMLILSSGGSENDIPPFTDQMFGHTFFYDSFTVNQLLQHCSELGLNVIKSILLNTPDGKRDKGRLGVVLQKSKK
ncbi:class I SAM-dependent methyltransferase [Cellvibrio mixtus]|uniref:class I SAM-dependent methyltransferase n=1 Tax=Cellvibrio mixtus TaxID=39650 RepID=UPI000587B2C6|nr:class I SAM-dependent methyltransferase [Cellvibrio mixtus]